MQTNVGALFSLPEVARERKSFFTISQV